MIVIVKYYDTFKYIASYNMLNNMTTLKEYWDTNSIYVFILTGLKIFDSITYAIDSSIFKFIISLVIAYHLFRLSRFCYLLTCIGAVISTVIGLYYIFLLGNSQLIGIALIAEVFVYAYLLYMTRNEYKWTEKTIT